MTEENTNPTTPAAAYTPSPQALFNQAINSGDLKAADAALKNGADINLELSQNGQNLLMKAVNASDYELTKWALDRNAQADTIKNSSTPLIRAVDNKAFSVARLLLERGADANFPTMDKGPNGAAGKPAQLPLHRAAFNGNEPMVRLLLRHGADINAPARDGANALWFAATNRRGRMTNLLLDAGANPDAIFDDRKTQFMPHPMYGGGNLRNGKFTTALHEFKTYQMRDPLILEERIAINRALLDAGADVHMKDSEGKTPKQAIETQENGASMAALFKQYEQLKPFDPASITTLRRKNLFSLDENGNALLDSPSTWKHFDAIADHLKSIGEPLRVEDMHAKNMSGKTWLERGVECFAVQDIIKHLAPAHEPNSMNKLFKATRPDVVAADVETMPDALRAAASRLQLNRIFAPKLWEGRTKGEFSTLYGAVPENLRDDISNYQRTLVSLPAQRPTQGKGIGRYEVGGGFSR